MCSWWWLVVVARFGWRICWCWWGWWRVWVGVVAMTVCKADSAVYVRGIPPCMFGYVRVSRQIRLLLKGLWYRFLICLTYDGIIILTLL